VVGLKLLLVREGAFNVLSPPSMDEALKLLPSAERVWLDLTFDEASAKLEALAKVGPPPHLISKALDGRGPSYTYSDGWCLLKLPVATEARVALQRGLSLIFNDRVLLSIHPRDVHSSEEEMDTATRQVRYNMAYAVYQVADRLLDDFDDLIGRLDAELSKLEDEIVESQGREEALRKVLARKRRLLLINKGLWQLKDTIHTLRRAEPHFMDKELDEKFNRLSEEVERQIDLIEMYRVMVSDIINIYATTLSNRLNVTVKELTVAMLYLTVIATVIGFPNTVATIFGVPTLAEAIEAHWILILLVGSAILPIFWLKSFLASYRRET